MTYKNIYYENFKKKNEDKIKKKNKCEICSGIYSYYTKSKHQKTKKHLKAIEYLNEVQEIKNKELNLIDSDSESSIDSKIKKELKKILWSKEFILPDSDIKVCIQSIIDDDDEY